MPRCLTLLTVALGCLSSAIAETAITRGPYLQVAHESGVTVVWRTDGPMVQPRVLIQKADSDATLEVKGENILARGLLGEAKLSTAPAATVQYEAAIAGLKPETAYRYMILDGDTADAFRTGTNVLALEGHNAGNDSSDLSLDPSLILETGK